ncbi:MULTISPECIES: hypothetical protein [unclassified Roseovarius]|uniref:hypothetical protein n=1 Tax=unclassified Roseovarius TaxID=2614913 RepID=UPI00273F5CA4|nr:MULTISPECIES: hypothetical protein [unclassified Roseovarius]
MSFVIVSLVLTSAVMHPLWNVLLKKYPDPQLGYLFLTATMGLCALCHGLVVGADFSAALAVWPLIGASLCGQILYGTCLTATLSRGDLSAYYPIIRSSPVFVVLVSFVLFGQTYPWTVLLGIFMAVTGGFMLLYRRGSRILEDWRALALALLAMCGTGIYSLADAGAMKTIEPQVLVALVEGPLVLFYGALWLRQRSTRTVTPQRPGNFSWLHIILPGALAYSSYYLILIAYQLGGDVAAVTSMRQASIPISVLLGGLFLREGAMARRLFAAGLLALGIVVIALSD